MSQRNISLSIFFPAFNEEENIRATVTQAQAIAEKISNDYEIIVVNDGSKDRTGKIADELAASDHHIKVVHHNPNQGYGAAVWSGVQAATKDYVFFTDADLQFDLSELENLVEHVPQYDVVIGYRYKRQDPFMRLVNAKGWNILNRILFGLRVRDIDSAFKLFKRDIVKDVPVKTRGAMLSAELLVRLQRQGVVFKEIPVTHLPRLKGSPTGAKPSVIVRAFKEMINIYHEELGDIRHIMLSKFVMLGAVNTFVDWLWYLALTRSFGVFADHLVLAKGVAFLIGSIPIFLGNAYWVFPKGSPITTTDHIKLYSILAAAFFINTAALSGFLILGFNDVVALILATGTSFVWNMSVAWILLIKDRVRIMVYKTA
ncbi:bifunctional glycosyltransferase family 2/GtrA family protein [Candidatus Parcubacteria bacterium]|nr:bifunctional glycosyltransferase family 2/GtrA family protein [Candidatus Parcubacteria bacterium]